MLKANQWHAENENSTNSYTVFSSYMHFSIVLYTDIRRSGDHRVTGVHGGT